MFTLESSQSIEIAGPPGTETRSRRQPWTRAEKDILSTHYPQGGLVVCQFLLPHRDSNSIRSMKSRLGLHILHRQQPTKVDWTPAIDAQIRAAYSNPIKGTIKSAAARLGIPYGAFRYRAAILGCVLHCQSPRWTDAENEMLESWGDLGLRSIQNKLAAAGYKRSLAGIQSQLQRLGNDSRDPDRFSAGHLAKLCGVDGSVVRRWIKKGWLKAKKEPAKFVVNPTEPWIWMIRRKDFRLFLQNYPSAIDLRKVDSLWFIEITVGLPKKK